MGERRRCAEEGESQGYVHGIDKCAASCKGKSSLFSYGTYDVGMNSCSSSGKWCKCICETAGTADGRCSFLYGKGFRLYSIYIDKVPVNNELLFIK